jgi:hypothetical protein
LSRFLSCWRDHGLHFVSAARARANKRVESTVGSEELVWLVIWGHGVPTLNCHACIGLLNSAAKAPELYEGAANPFPWMSEMVDLRKEVAFFERRPIEYQTGGARASFSIR